MRTLRVVLTAVLLSGGLSLEAQEPPSLTFYGVSPDKALKEADAKLSAYLSQRLQQNVNYDDRFDTAGDLIRKLITTSDRYLARMTPYSYVAAEMLGARVQIIGTYQSKATGTATYRSYFVVNKQAFAGHAQTLDGVYDYLQSLHHTAPARFIYHDKFSTSSYLLPALWFRSRHIFAADQPAANVIRITAQRQADSSSQLVGLIADGAADLAAVWDGTKAGFVNDGRVLFIPLPSVLPNDLLVASASVDQSTKTSLINAVRDMRSRGPINVGDVVSWVPIAEAPEAMEALAGLKRLSAAPPAPVVVRVLPEVVEDAEHAAYVDEARQALRLAGTEFVLFAPDVHREVDADWTVTRLHTGAVVLRSRLQRFDTEQEFYLTFTPSPGDLANRIVSLMHSRMHRIRYIWPYQDAAPTIIRDVNLMLPKDAPVRVQRLTWRDPNRNEFVAGDVFETSVNADRYKFTFNMEPFRRESGATDFQNPLSNVAYRVLLERRSPESRRSKVLAGTLIGLLLLTATGATVDLRRRLKPVPPQRPVTLPEVCAALAAQSHGTWYGRRLKDADLLYCARPRLEQLIEELKGRGLVSTGIGGVTTLAYRVQAGLPLPFIGKAVSAEASRRVDLVVDPARVGDTVRLDAVLDLMLRRQLLSSFVGRPLEWDALNELARRILPDAEAGEELVREHDNTIVAIASRNFNQVLEDALSRVSLFPGTWTVQTIEGRQVARQQIALPGPLRVGDAKRPVTGLLLEFNVPGETSFPLDSDTPCWLFGKIVRLTHVEVDETHLLSVHLRTYALLIGDAASAHPAPPARRTSPRRQADTEEG